MSGSLDMHIAAVAIPVILGLVVVILILAALDLITKTIHRGHACRARQELLEAQADAAERSLIPRQPGRHEQDRLEARRAEAEQHGVRLIPSGAPRTPEDEWLRRHGDLDEGGYRE